MSDIEIKGGTLMKRSRNRSAISNVTGVNWQLRRISLTETRVAYGTVDGPPKDFVPVNATTTAHIEEPMDGKDFPFRIVTGTEELILNATSNEDRNDWIEAVKKAANPQNRTNDDAANKLSTDMEKTKLDNNDAAKNAAENAAKNAAENAAKNAANNAAHNAASNLTSGLTGGHHTSGGMMSGLTSSLTSSVTSGLTNAASNALTNAGNTSAAALELAAKEAKEKEAKEKLYAGLRIPNPCKKKLSTETTMHARFIWIKETEKEFHWGKTNDANKSKCISITNNVKSVKSNPDINEPNFTIELDNPESVFQASMFAGIPSSIDIIMEDSTMNNGFISYINDLKNNK